MKEPRYTGTAYIGKTPEHRETANNRRALEKKLRAYVRAAYQPKARAEYYIEEARPCGHEWAAYFDGQDFHVTAY